MQLKAADGAGDPFLALTALRKHSDHLMGPLVAGLCEQLAWLGRRHTGAQRQASASQLRTRLQGWAAAWVAYFGYEALFVAGWRRLYRQLQPLRDAINAANVVRPPMPMSAPSFMVPAPKPAAEVLPGRPSSCNSRATDPALGSPEASQIPSRSSSRASSRLGLSLADAIAIPEPVLPGDVPGVLGGAAAMGDAVAVPDLVQDKGFMALTSHAQATREFEELIAVQSLEIGGLVHRDHWVAEITKAAVAAIDCTRDRLNLSIVESSIPKTRAQTHAGPAPIDAPQIWDELRDDPTRLRRYICSHSNVQSRRSAAQLHAIRDAVDAVVLFSALEGRVERYVAELKVCVCAPGPSGPLLAKPPRPHPPTQRTGRPCPRITAPSHPLFSRKAKCLKKVRTAGVQHLVIGIPWLSTYRVPA